MGVWKLVRNASVAVGLLAATPLAASAGCPGPCITDAEIEKTLRQYSDPLFTAGGLVASDVNIYLLNDPSMNAMAFAGQNMAINTGLIIAAENPEMLKGVIAHETAHITLGHNITRRQALDATSGISMISIGLGVLAMAAGAPDAGMALIGSAQTFQALAFFKYTRIEESAADQAGLSYMEATSQSADGLIAFFEKFRYEELMSSNRQDPYFRTHPISADRVQMMRMRGKEVNAKAQPQSAKDLEEFARMKAKLFGFLMSPSRVAQKYPKTDTSIPARYARAIAAYRAVDIKAALAETQSLIDDEPNNPYFQELYGQILFENARVEDSVPYHRKSVELAPDEPLLKVNLARSLIETKKPADVEEAKNMLIDALAQDRENAFAWNQLAKAYGAQNKIGDADLATAEEAYVIGDVRRAQVFARRAVAKLDPATPSGRRADDITTITDPRASRGG